MNYEAPIAEISFVLKGIGDIATVAPDLSAETFAQVLTEAGRFAAEVLEPIDKIGDRHGPVLDPATATVTTPYGWKPAWKVFAEAGWIGLSAPQDLGGQGLPVMLQASVEEIWNAANPSFAVGVLLTQSAIHALSAHATDPSLRPTIERLVGGTWTATMNLTEQAAGSDLNGVRTTAVPAPDGTYRISGVKIFITYGEHDLAGNIIHLVLARLPDAPAGTRGLSLFVVPKLLPDGDGGHTVRNAVRAIGVERKLGLHGSPTCTMAYEEATGFLVGEANRGLAAMFTMMNLARLSVGVQGLGVAERAYQGALAYARERRQGRAPGWTGEGMSPIVFHPDVAAMLLRMKSLTAGARALTLATAHALDLSHRAADPDARAAAADRASLLTPLAKAFPTDAAIEVANLGIQVHGGAGYIEETGAAQRLRDARIFAIYEGTNGIQAIDLVTRKL
ncbi:MAG TPA: acyl-CoA dehydrogenase family protein, partial [Bauldia sp.]|nr:acyl-CoA dehydrogenase family protein [Bauldia sp.]